MTTELDGSGPFDLELRDDGVAVIWFDVPGARVNTLQDGFADDMHDVLDTLEDLDIDGVVIASAKQDNFCAGADVGMLAGAESAQQVTDLSRTGQLAFDRLADFSRPVVAAIHGDCLGGGLELAMACHGRVASNSDATRLGQPEIKLGLIPGAGGTQRLPRLIGLQDAITLIVTGGRRPAAWATKRGLVDEVVHPAVLVDVAAQHALRLARKPEDTWLDRVRAALPGDFQELLMEDNPAGRRILFNQAEKNVRRKTGGHMPAPLKALEVIEVGVREGMRAGLQAEAEAFGELAMSPVAANLMYLFRSQTALKGDPGIDSDAEPRDVRKVGVLGAGLMGSGIARVTAESAGLRVRLKDIADEPLRDGLRAIRRDLDEQVDKRRMHARERDRIMARVLPTTDYSGFAHVDVTIEAVVENLDVKHAVLADVEEHTGEHHVFASNTSSLPITRIAEGAEAPERVVGMHYFSPVDAVPLLEVITAEHTADWVTATAVALGKKQGKTVIVVNDGTGFYTTRILAPYMNEAAYLLSEGASIESIDAALSGWGFPVGPIKLLDEVGIDVGDKIGRIMVDAFGERMAPPAVQGAMTDDDREGRKNGRGFYTYEQRGGRFQRTGGVDASVYELLGIEPRDDAVDRDEIVRRCVLAMVNEAARCYGEGVLRSARDGDVGAVFGLGFPAHQGGPFRWLDARGAVEVLAELRGLQDRFGERFAPAPLLEQLAESGLGIHDEGAPRPGATG